MIDAWAQHPTPRFAGLPMFDSLRRWGAGLDTAPPVSVLIESMDAAGVDQALISAWHGPHGALISNDEVAAFAAEYPDRLHGVASADLSKPMDAVRELRRAVGDLHFKALRILPWLWETPPTDRRFYPLYATCVDLGVPFCTQVGHTGPLMPSEVGRPIPYIDQVAIDFPELTIVGGHIGYPWTEEMVAVCRKHQNVYIDTSAYVPGRYPPELLNYMRTTSGAQKVLWGTNFPMLTHERAQQGLDDLEGIDRDAFTDGNARRVFNL
ncbi:MAG: uncharacterized protein QOF76_1216 [Solirubrobacteraceae bacterium]|jgi:predicted TIM-barrel fold metal-dependent hydrolase|nr:uncharacterized protein [Solirubrobacteraceae bacterium]